MEVKDSLLKEASALDIISFIKQYHELEKAPFEEGYILIKKVYPEQYTHLCNHWKGKKKAFGSFYLNLSTSTQIHILHEFGIVGEADEKYLKDKEEDEIRTLFAPAPPVVDRINKAVLFFLNHGISENVYNWLTLSKIPKSDKRRFGDSHNWAEYLLSLSWEEQERILESIHINYKG